MIANGAYLLELNATGEELLCHKMRVRVGCEAFQNFVANHCETQSFVENFWNEDNQPMIPAVTLLLLLSAMLRQLKMRRVACSGTLYGITVESFAIVLHRG